jgi:hypothetical protein
MLHTYQEKLWQKIDYDNRIRSEKVLKEALSHAKELYENDLINDKDKLVALHSVIVGINNYFK